MEKMETYNGYVEQEDSYYKKLETLEQCQHAIVDHIYRYREIFDKLTAEEVLLAVHQLEETLRLELLHLKLAKAFLAFELK
ncbi:hypothetical protein [Paenibacillus polymyxa]|uniref:hypothetical protein n=1 Tax=Paenibacillus TaxID=44249 RepID=UPI00077C4CB0|nr:hypothetical protein [Paenibacillus polymyxa]AOK89377.1 hypothetical protein AOU00_05810 [Paenibacillus polymyxa]KYG96479.1 hypothetical protein AZE31_22230 [Paenibacillus polymyxa]